MALPQWSALSSQSLLQGLWSIWMPDLQVRIMSPSPLFDLATNPCPDGGLSSLASPREIVMSGASAFPGLLSEAWLGDAARVEDGWTDIKRKKNLSPLFIL